MAEVHFKNKEWKKAILSYQKYSEDSPKGKMVAEAKYKIGVSFRPMNFQDLRSYLAAEKITTQKQIRD